MKNTHLLHTEMIESIEKQDLQKIQKLIAEGAKINYVNNSWEILI
jgi:hypothetical protein